MISADFTNGCSETSLPQTGNENGIGTFLVNNFAVIRSNIIPKAAKNLEKKFFDRFWTSGLALKRKFTASSESSPLALRALFRRIQALPAPPFPAYVLRWTIFTTQKYNSLG
jgi:hypothetical protein